MSESEKVAVTPRAIKKCAEWLKFCLDIGWAKQTLNDLEKLWWQYHDEQGRLKKP